MNNITDKIRNQAMDQVDTQFSYEVWCRILEQVRNQVWHQISNQVKERVRSQVWKQIWESY